jgi:hypothetical protein
VLERIGLEPLPGLFDGGRPGSHSSEHLRRGAGVERVGRTPVGDDIGRVVGDQANVDLHGGWRHGDGALQLGNEVLEAGEVELVERRRQTEEPVETLAVGGAVGRG